jgi:hypothetical protein
VAVVEVAVAVVEVAVAAVEVAVAAVAAVEVVVAVGDVVGDGVGDVEAAGVGAGKGVRVSGRPDSVSARSAGKRFRTSEVSPVSTCRARNAGHR